MVKTSHFERMAKYYDFFTKILMLGTYGRVRQEIVDSPKVGRALDLCCGTGYVTGHINAESVVGLDLSSGMLKINREKTEDKKNVHAVVGDAFSLPFPENSFHAVYNTLAAHEFKNISNILKEAYRVLKPGGRLVLYDFSKPANLFLRYTYLPFLKHIVELGTFYAYTPEEWTKTLEKIGFKDIETEVLYWASVLVKARK